MAGRTITILLLGLICGGCSFVGSGPSQVQLTDAAGAKFSQVFTQGYVSRTASGDWHILLIDDGIRTPPGQQAGAVLKPVAEAPLRQVVHLHVFWRPSEGAKPDNPAATNAAIDWRILGTGAEQFENALRYQGSAFIAIDGDGPQYGARIRQGEMRLRKVTGNLHDPLGETHLRGDLYLQRDDAVVTNMLRQLQADDKDTRP